MSCHPVRFFPSGIIFFIICVLSLRYTVADNEEDICEEPPPPLNGELTCGKLKKNPNTYVCRAKCDPGYRFPDKSGDTNPKKWRNKCDLRSGKWTPFYEFPDCQSICNPPCENEGVCTEENHCICIPSYRGDRCQYALDLCEPEKGLHVSAEWACNHNAEQTSCTMHCPQGTKSESVPADSYLCSLDGAWTPSFAPKCVPINIIQPPSENLVSGKSYHPIITNKLVTSDYHNSGVCAVWGNTHVRTFDGGIYSFEGPCTYLLSKDCEQNTFAIHIQNEAACETVSSCSTSLVIFIGSQKYVLSNGQGTGPIVEVGGKVHVIPDSVDGLLFQMLSDYVTVSSPLGFRLKWNRKNTVLLKASNLLENRTCGLCGKPDGSVLNDFETSDGSITDNAEAFVNSWTMEDLGEKCKKQVVVKDPCSENKEKNSQADNFCHVIFDKKFASCHEVVDPQIYFEVCKMDQCACPYESCYCGTLAEYFRECTRLGGDLNGGWRSNKLCPLSCPDGMVYKDCGDSCPKTCKGTVYDCEDNHCVDGCHCPDGMILHHGQCVEKKDCPCMHNGKEHPVGTREMFDCNACECIASEWKCTQDKCKARCSSTGDPHYTTFDGLGYDFFGSCSYYLVYNENFTIVQETGPCPASSGTEPATERMYCTKKVEIKYFDEILLLEPGIKVAFNGKSSTLPISTPTITAFMASDSFLTVNLINGMSILWNGENSIYIDAPSSMIGQTSGLCGTFNKNQKDDFLTPSKDIEADVASFASRWEATEGCHKKSRRSARSPCESQPQKLKDAELLCSTLKLNTFESCHDQIDPGVYYKSCVSDLCMCGHHDLRLCLCPILADYSLACTTKGVIVNWMDDITSCKPECNGGQIYQECGNPCTSSCTALASFDVCTQLCVQGCACPEGLALNNEGFCIAIDQCPCNYEDKEYLPYSVTVQGPNICTCQGAKWQCQSGSASEIALLDRDDSVLECLNENNEEHTQCKEECPRTCQNMHLPVECKTETCKPGCRCKEGFLFDSEKNKCVKESECGCIHGRKRYKEGETMRQLCNLCTCLGGLWQCTEKECPAICSVWGESHFKTFDDKIFDFQGSCEYVLSKGKMKGVSYSVTVQNVPCGTSGVTCSKFFTLDLGPKKPSGSDSNEIAAEAEILTLTKDEPLPKTSYNSRFAIVEAGLFVTIYTDIGLSIQWDKGTRIYITIEPRWRKRVQGLCGNFNDDQSDDFLTPSGGLPEARSSIFAESWKVQEFCPHLQDLEDLCEIHPHRKSWSQQKCGILVSDVFAACHSEVPLVPYYDRCIFDTCACDMGGDCGCLCTAIAAYAQECNRHGVSIKWRTQELCPIQCEECGTYESCISPCPKKTCENEIFYQKIEQACTPDFCVEGCNPKPCPPGQVYNNGREYKCIPEIECKIPCMELNGKLYMEGDRISDLQVVDACQTCHCLRGSISCTGPPCYVGDIKDCVRTGWTPWMNTPAVIGGDFEMLTDPILKATLENYCGIANMTSIDCRIAETKQPYRESGQKVSCQLPYGLSCEDEAQKDSVCQDYEIRVYCDCGQIPATELTTPVIIPESLPPVCDETGWSAWMSTNVPSDEGEFETLDRLRLNHYFCAGDMLEKIECRSRMDWHLVTAGNENIVCNRKVGLVCRGRYCDDYEVRVYCNCGGEITTASVPACVTGWTEYFNTDHPDTSDVGDDETLDRIRSVKDFCIGGTIEDIECKAVVGGKLIDYTELDTFGLKCSKNVGFECNKYVRPEQCQDFTVRFFCACEPLPIITSTTTTTEATITSLPITPVPTECGWTPWLNIGSPDSEVGDIEDLTKLQIMYKTCGGKDLIDIECRMARTLHKYSESLQNNLICDIDHGFRCLNDDQVGKCYDYEVRLLCMYPWCYPPTTTPVPTMPPTLNPCPDGKVYDPCAFHCDHLCSSLAVKLEEECQNGEVQCIAGCRPASGCESPKVWRDYYTCVSKENCICAIKDENGTIINVAPNEMIEIGCDKCQCIENTITCQSIPGCGATTPPSKEIVTAENIVRESCWTEWINMDKPFESGGDLEVPSKYRKRYDFCFNPVKIECRTALSHQSPFDIGQHVKCDIKEGLICWNKDNKPEGCYDYEIRFFCPCPSQVPTTTMLIPTLEPGVCKYGWTDWFNTRIPDARGDYETIQSSRIFHSFCSNDMINAIECRQVGKKTGLLQNGVICDLDIGLKCNSEYMFNNEVCSDYEVRFFCDCPTIAPPIEALPPTTTQQPVSEACSYWSQWFNEHHPDSAEGIKKGVKGHGGNTGDTERVMVIKLRNEFQFCINAEVTDIECREADTHLDYTETGDKKLVCSLQSGFRCRSKDQPDRLCKDYKIRYFCSCTPESTTTPLLLKPTPPSVTIPPCTETFYKIIDGPLPLPDTYLKASTSKDSSSGPQNARLSSVYGAKSAGAWIAGELNEQQFLEIDLGFDMPVYGVITKGRSGHQQWVKSYKVLYSRDGIVYSYIKDLESPDGEKVFSGNFDSDTEVQHIFKNPIKARFIRIQPITFHRSIAMRFDVLGCYTAEYIPTTTETINIPVVPPCTDEIGMYDGYIEDYQISVSSTRNNSSDGRFARLNTLQTETHTGGWVAGELNDKQFIQVDLLATLNITGLKTQGRDMVPQWVTAFYISYSQNGVDWNIMKDSYGSTIIFPGNYDSSTTVITYFDHPIRARFIRIHPEFWENWIAMRFEILGCNERNKVKSNLGTTTTTERPRMFGDECYEPMGFQNHVLPDTLISVSSSYNENSGPSRIRLHTHPEGQLTGGWIAATYDYQPVILIDFVEKRNLTGIETQGLEDNDYWVMSYRVYYSLDNETWYPVKEEEFDELNFQGNNDRNSEELRWFNRMITTRFLKIVILDYHTAPALRMELMGCFKPYIELTTRLSFPQTTTEMCVQLGPWISLSDPVSSSFGDEEPIANVIAASAVCDKPYEIECRTIVTKVDSSQVGQSVTCDLTHGLVCRNEDQSSYQCYNYEVRIKCWTCHNNETTTLHPLELCPEIPELFKEKCPESCPLGFACDGIDCIPSTDCPCFKNGKRFEPSNMIITQDCFNCDCILGGHSRCEPIKCEDCLPGQKPHMDSSCHCDCVGCAIGTVLCPTSGECIKEEQWCDGIHDCPDDEKECPTTTTLAPTITVPSTTIPPPICSTDYLPDTDSCEMTANIFETFDGMTYQYDVCEHVLMKENSLDLYSVSVHQTCTPENFCYRYLLVVVDSVTIKLGPGIEDVTLGHMRVPVENLWLISQRFPDFELKKKGNLLVFRSYKYHFDVSWNLFEDAKITVSRCSIQQLVGLCGLYNKLMEDDLTLPNGNVAKNSDMFGNSWAIGSLEKCKPPLCPIETMRIALEMCNQLSEEPFNSSCNEYVKMENLIEACVVHICECMQRPHIEAKVSPSKDMYDFFDTGSCKCQAYESFVETCEERKQGPVKEWRMRHDCTPECPVGMEWQDCGPGCELTCDNYRQAPELCGSECVPGCYCPPGLVRHHNRCVKLKMCQDCVCRGHGDPNFISFDGQYYSFQGICSYILAQHQTADDDRMNFKVVVTNVECPEEPNTSCADGLTVYWNGHIIEKFKTKPVYIDQKPLSAADSPLDYEGISVTFVPNKSTIILIKDINLAVRYFDQMYGFNIELPAFFYYNKTEGLCGVCNFIKSDDLYHRDGYVAEDVDEFAFSWLVEHESRQNCELVRVKVPEPPPGICNFTTSPCDIFLDPSLYYKSCQNDVNYSWKPEASMCRSKFQYAQQCCERNIDIVEWLLLSGCESDCPKGMEYKCTSACPKTCDNYKNYQKDDCSLMPLYTCVCPEGEVQKLGKCVKPIQCEVCDIHGHEIGDVWDEGPCKSCECLPDLSISCTVQECALPPVCDTKETLQKLERPANACCDHFQCMPGGESRCAEQPLDDCPPGHAYVKDSNGSCAVYRCECIKDLCPPSVVPLLDDGEISTLVAVDCCPTFKVMCTDDCAPPPKCNPGFELSTYEGKCCNKYTCIPKKNVCVYHPKYDVVNGTQVDLMREDPYEIEYEPGSSWQDGLCRKCTCIYFEGQSVYNCRDQKCLDPSDLPNAKEYFIEEIHIPGDCCPKYHRTACLVQGIKYEVDEEWPSPEADPCKSYRCVLDKNGEAIRMEKTSICSTGCPDNAVYIQAEPGSGKCCGVCKPTACEENGILYENGATWISKAKPCFTAECLVTENGTRVTYRGESCPVMPDNCPPENVRTDSKGCCTYCKITTETCSAVEVPLYETRGFFGFVDTQRGLCSNEQTLHNLTKCGGQCSSKSLYSDLIGDFQSVCNCCLPKKSFHRTVVLECEDGSHVEKVYLQPTDCECLSCSGNNNNNLEAMNQVEPYKK